MTADYNAARAYAFEYMDQRLPPGLAYHGLSHTRDQVLPAVELFCRDMDIARHEQILVATAAVFHDIGFVRRYSENEEIGAALAASILPDFGYDTSDIVTVRRLILATAIPHKPETLLAEILCDADLVSLGQDIFFETSMMLRRERMTFLRPVALKSWLEEQYTFLVTHRYHTVAARTHLNEGKEKNMKELRQVLHCSQPSGRFHE